MKRTRTDSLMWLLVVIVTAALCAVARRIQLNTAFEGDLNLPIPGAPAAILFLALCVLAAAALLLMARKLPVSPFLKDDPGLVLHAEGDALFMGGMVLAAFLCLIAAPVLFISGRQMWVAYQAALELARAHGNTIPGGNNGLLTFITGITSALSFIALLVVGKAAFRNLKKGRLAVLLPAINNCLWLMEFYRSHAANPVRWNYAPLLVAIVAGILFYLDWAGLYAGVFAPRRTLWMAGMTVILSLSALMGEWSLSSALLLTAQLVAALAVLWCVPHNLRYPPEPVSDEAPAEEKLEEETHE